MGSITLGTEVYEVTQAKLKLWLELGSIQKQLSEAVEIKDFAKLPELIESYVSTASGALGIDNLPWEELIDAFLDISKINSIDFEIPLLLTKLKDEGYIPWDYDGREWYFWANIICKEYGWELDKVEFLEVEDAVKLIQEIFIDRQLQKEWEWALSDRALHYDSNTKQTTFKPLDRPDWMMKSVKPIPRKIVQIPEHLMPLGNVVHVKSQ